MVFAETDDQIRRCFPALKVLRPHLREEDFVARIRRQQTQGYRLAFHDDADTEAAASVAGFRLLEYLAWGRALYIDDLVTRPDCRGRGCGGALLEAVVAHAEASGCDAVHLDSGYQRHDAHRLYLNHGFRLTTHHFARQLAPPGETP